MRDQPDLRYDRAHGARFLLDRRTGSYTILSPRPQQGGRVIVTLHGWSGTAVAEYREWLPYAERHGLGIAAVEWQTSWVGGGSFIGSRAIYEMARRALRAEGAPPGRALLHGFSLGSFRSFDLTSYDRQHAHLFALTLAESGGESGAPDRTLAGSRWVLYCAGRDHGSDTGCSGMRGARSFLQASGATVDDLIVDPPAGHGGMLSDRTATERALSYYLRG